MSDKKKKSHKYDGATFDEIIKESMHKGTMTHFAAALIEEFSEEEKEVVLNRARGMASWVDQLKLLVERLEKESSNG